MCMYIFGFISVCVCVYIEKKKYSKIDEYNDFILLFSWINERSFKIYHTDMNMYSKDFLILAFDCVGCLFFFISFHFICFCVIVVDFSWAGKEGDGEQDEKWNKMRSHNFEHSTVFFRLSFLSISFSAWWMSNDTELLIIFQAIFGKYWPLATHNIQIFCALFEWIAQRFAWFHTMIVVAMFKENKNNKRHCCYIKMRWTKSDLMWRRSTCQCDYTEMFISMHIMCLCVSIFKRVESEFEMGCVAENRMFQFGELINKHKKTSLMAISLPANWFQSCSGLES